MHILHNLVKVYKDSERRPWFYHVGQNTETYHMVDGLFVRIPI